MGMLGIGKDMGAVNIPQPMVPSGEVEGRQGVGENARNEEVRGARGPERQADPFAGKSFEKPAKLGKIFRQIGGYDAQTRYKKLLEISNPLAERHYDRSSYRGQYEMICDAATGFCRKFVEGNLDKMLADALEALSKEEAGCKTEAGRSEVARKRKSLVDYVKQIKSSRMELVQHITTELAKAHDRLLDVPPDTAEYAKAIDDSLGDIKAALRNFRYRFDREHSLMTGYSHFKRAIGQFFSNSRSKHDDEAAAQFKDLSALENRFKEMVGGAFADEFSVERKRALSEECHFINEAIRNIDNSVDQRGYAFELAKSMIQGMMENGGEKTIDVSGAVGVGLKLGIFDAKFMAKGHHYYRLSSNGDGTLTVEHLNQLGVAARAETGVDNLAKLDLGAEFGGGTKRMKNTSKTFKDVESAARYLSGDIIGKLNPHTFLANAGKLLKDIGLKAADYVFVKPFFTPFGWLARNALWLAGVDTKQDAKYGDGGVNGEQDFVNRMTRGNILGKVGERIMPGANILESGKRKFDFYKGSGEATGTFQTGIFKLKGGVSEDLEKQTNAVKTDYKPYMAMLEGELHGTMLSRVERDFGVGGRADETAGQLFVTGGEGLVRISQLIIKPGQRKPETILKSLADISKAMNDFALSFAGDKKAKAPASDISRYRATARVAAALFEMWEALDGEQVSKDQAAEFERLSALVRRGVTNPAVKFPPELIQRELMASRSYKDDLLINRASLSFNFDALGSHSFMLMGGNEVLSGSRFANRMARSGFEGALSGAGGLSGVLQNGVEAEFVTRVPKSQHRRPWQNDRRTEINLRLGPDSPIVDAILTAVGAAVAKRTKEDSNPVTVWDWLNVGRTVAGGAGVSALTRIAKDIQASYSFGDVGGKLLEKQGEALNVNAESILGRFDMRSGRNIQLVLENGRLTSIAFGDHSKMDLRFDVGELIVAEGEFKMNSVTNRNNFALDPSFHSLLSKCDGMMQPGNLTNWTQYATKQHRALARMADIVRDTVNGGRRRDVGGDKKAKTDGDQFLAIFDKMREDMARVDRMSTVRSTAFRKNFSRFNELLAEISSNGKDTDELVKGRQMQHLLECVSRHFNLVDLDLSADETVDPDLRQFRHFAAENSNGSFRIARSGSGHSSGASGVTLATDDRVMKLGRSPEVREANNETRRRLLRSIIADLELARKEDLEQVRETSELVQRLPPGLRFRFKLEDFDDSGKPLTAYRIGRMLDQLAEYRTALLLADDPVELAAAEVVPTLKQKDLIRV